MNQNKEKLTTINVPTKWASIIDQMVTELAKAEEKHPSWPTDIIHASAVVGEESGELIRACLQVEYENGSIAEAKKEAIQTGAMAIRFLAHL